MAVTVTQVFRNSIMAAFNVEATADADAAAVIPHGLPGVPVVLTTPHGTAAQVALTTWGVGVVDGTNVNLAKGVGAGSGFAGTSVSVLVMLNPGQWPGGLLQQLGI